MKYKVGDIIKLRDDLEAGEYYDGIQFMEGMNYLKNKAIDIEECFEELTGDWYKVVGKWGITEKMIEGLWEECKSSEQVSKSSEQVSKYRLIDILNKIANGELKEGTKIKSKEKNEVFTLRTRDEYGTELDLFDEDNYSLLRDYWLIKKLNEECELIEPQEPTEEKIYELKDWYELPDGLTSEEKMQIIWNKLNEVIRKINKED